MIGRSNHSQKRIFPVISPNIYSSTSSNEFELTADQQVARNLLALANQKLFAGLDWRRGQLEVRRKFGYLLLQHRLGIEAELASQWQRADSFWLTLQTEFKALSTRQELWQELAQTLANTPEVRVMNKPAQLRQRLVDELLIDTHCAFYNGLMQQQAKPSWRDAYGKDSFQRAFVHIDYIQQLLEFSIVRDEVGTLLQEAWQTRITACQQAKKWQQAIYYCQVRLKYSPNVIDFQSELVEVIYLATLAKLVEAKTKIQQFQNAKTLLTGISELEKCLKNYPHNLTIFQLLGNLYHLQAINLFSNHQLSESLVLIQKAITYNPYLEQAIQTRKELMQMMNQWQQMRHSELFQEGQYPFAEADRGFAPMNAYINSEAAKETAKAFHIAEAFQEQSNHSLVIPSSAAVEEPPILTPAYMAPQPGSKPMFARLLSFPYRRIKLQMAVACVLVLVAILVRYVIA